MDRSELLKQLRMDRDAPAPRARASLLVLAAAVLLAVTGGVLWLVLARGALAYVYCDGVPLSTLNFNTFSQVAFDFRVTPELLAQGFVWALCIGLAAGLLPAVRAARLPVTEALRAG